jgi:hypothetical protein
MHENTTRLARSTHSWLHGYALVCAAQMHQGYKDVTELYTNISTCNQHEASEAHDHPPTSMQVCLDGTATPAPLNESHALSTDLAYVHVRQHVTHGALVLLCEFDLPSNVEALAVENRVALWDAVLRENHGLAEESAPHKGPNAHYFMQITIACIVFCVEMHAAIDVYLRS